jgi:hypothetical protein
MNAHSAIKEVMIRKKGSRKIVVDGHSYRWVVKRIYDYQNGRITDMLLVAPDQKPGQKMIALFEDRKLHEADQITPGVVRKLIFTALAQGWQPQKAGGPYRVSNVNEILKTYDLEQAEKIRADGQERVIAIKHQMKKPPVKAARDKHGWLTCPNCELRFSAKDNARWDGRHHLTCGRKITIEEFSK